MINELFQLHGKAALVTGGSQGLGKEMAIILAAAGARVAITSRSQEVADAAAKEITAETGGHIVGIAAEASDEAQVKAAVEATVQALGGLNILVNNAGVNKRNPIDKFPSDEWNWVLSVNLTGPYLFTKYAVPFMKQRGWGRIVNVGSIQSFIGLPERGAYAATKAGLVGMTRAVAMELAQENITVNALCPGPVETEMNAAQMANPEVFKYFTDRIPMGRFAKPHEIRGPLLFLVSQASSFMTGQSLIVDGGWTAQ